MALVTGPALSVAVGSDQLVVLLPYGMLTLDGQFITTGAVLSVTEESKQFQKMNE